MIYGIGIDVVEPHRVVRLLEKYGAQQDPAALAAYQLVAEGRAEAVWDLESMINEVVTELEQEGEI